MSHFLFVAPAGPVQVLFSMLRPNVGPKHCMLLLLLLLMTLVAAINFDVVAAGWDILQSDSGTKLGDFNPALVVRFVCCRGMMTTDSISPICFFVRFQRGWQ